MKKQKQLPDFEMAKTLMMTLISGVADRDEEQTTAALEALAKEFGMSDYFNAVVGVVPSNPGGRARIMLDGSVHVE